MPAQDSKYLPRLLVLTSTYPRWNGDTLPPFVHELAHRLTTAFEVHVLAPHAAGSAEHESLGGVHVHRFHYLPEKFEVLAYTGGILPSLRRKPWRLVALPLFLTAQLISTIGLLRRYRFDAIHAHWILPQGLIAVLANKASGMHAKILCTGHGADVFALNGMIMRRLKLFTLKRCNKVTVVSNAMLNVLGRITSIDRKYSVIPMGVDCWGRFMPGKQSPDPSSLLFVGRLAEKKGVCFLLRALPLIKNHIGIKLSIIGSGTEEAELHQLAEQLRLNDCVEFTGPVPNAELPKYFQNSSILVFPSIITPSGDQEGFGLVIAEAMACGCAVVASGLPAVRDIIQDNKTGLLVAPESPQEIAHAVESLIENPEFLQRLSTEGRQFIVDNFDWELISKRYANLLKQMIASTA
ncbi:MAG: glycosyltransferase [Gammaproteobacteria bacterium]|nr:glycosyltransferase [Gammaproteobacteria bacterium]